VAANIIHHAIEMFLKAGLCAQTTEKQRRNQFGHSLPKMWRAWKSHYDPQGKLAGFDDCIEGLHEYEDIGYPEGMMKPAAIVLRMQFANAPMPKDPVIPNSKAKEFNLEMSEIDTLVRTTCEAGRY
jgi:hypothetical protein